MSVVEIGVLIFCLLSLGSVAGFLAGLLGVGGGMILVPGLFMIFESMGQRLDLHGFELMHLCVGTSLAIIIPTGYVSAKAHHKKGAVDLNLVRDLGISVVLGVTFGTFIASFVSGDTLKMIFATALLGLAFLMMTDPSRFKMGDTMPKNPLLGLMGIVIGTVSTLVGIGGATLSVPFMTMHGVAMHRAVGTASALGLVIAIPATLGFIYIGMDDNLTLPPYSLGYVNLLAWIMVIPASMYAAPYGARAAHRVSVRKLRRIFAMFMILVALNMWRKIFM